MVSLDIHWQQLLWKCYHHGKLVEKDDSKIKELMGNYLFLERPQDLPAPLNRKIDDTWNFSEGLKKGLYDLPDYPLKGEALHNYVLSWNQDDKIILDEETREEMGLTGNPFVYTYPERILRQITPSENSLYGGNFYIDQFNVMWNRLNENKGSNRAVATLYNPGIDRKRIDIPCLNWLQATIRNKKLELHCMFRSNDLYGAWPSNMYLLTFYGLWLTEQFFDDNISFNGIHYHSSSLHIYEPDLIAVKKILGDE